MGHEIVHENYPENCNRNKIQKEWDAAVRRICYQEGASGLNHPIRWIESKICENRDEAEKFIRHNDNGWYDQLAVRYYDYKPTSKMVDLEAKCKKAEEQYLQLCNKKHFENAKSNYIGCKKCGSKLSKEYLVKRNKPNHCPLCGNDLRPETALASIENAKKNLCKMKKNLEIERAKERKKKSNIRWLVKVEYHV